MLPPRISSKSRRIQSRTTLGRSKCDVFPFRLSNRSVVDNGVSLDNTTLFALKHNSSLMEEHRSVVESSKGVSRNTALVFHATYFETFASFSVRCIINIENWTAWRLKDALSHNHCGYIHEDYPAPNVDPAYREVMVGHKQVSPKCTFE